MIGLRFFLVAPNADGRFTTDDFRRERMIACVANTAVNSDTDVPIPNANANPFTPAVARIEQDERHQQRHDVGVHDRRQALLVAGRAAPNRPARISSLTRSKITMFASAAAPSVKIIPAIPGNVNMTGINSMIANRYSP